MPLNDPIALFKENTEAFESFLRALSTLHSTGVLEFLRERGRVRPVPENSPNYLQLMAARSSLSAGYNQALDELIWFKDLFLGQPVSEGNRVPMDFGSMEKAVESGDLTLEEAEALRNGQPIPELKREPLPNTVYIVKPGST